jgi:hypothetical protein
MENSRAVIGAIIFIVMILGANFIMYAIARGVTRSNTKSTLEMLGKALNTSTQKKDDETDELRRRVAELNGGKKDDQQDIK